MGIYGLTYSLYHPGGKHPNSYQYFFLSWTGNLIQLFQIYFLQNVLPTALGVTQKTYAMEAVPLAMKDTERMGMAPMHVSVSHTSIITYSKIEVSANCDDYLHLCVKTGKLIYVCTVISFQLNLAVVKITSCKICNNIKHEKNISDNCYGNNENNARFIFSTLNKPLLIYSIASAAEISFSEVFCYYCYCDCCCCCCYYCCCYH